MNAVRLPGLQVLILAAGFSSRLGEPKALARVHGVSLLRRTLKLAALVQPARIIAVVPRNAQRWHIEASGLNVCWAGNVSRARGLSSSVRRGITAARNSKAVLVLPVDLVNLRARELDRLISRWRASPRRLIARRIGLHGGTPLILPRWLYSKALEAKGDIGLRDMLRQLPRDCVQLVDLPSAALDVDTRHDLKIARRRLRGGG